MTNFSTHPCWTISVGPRRWDFGSLSCFNLVVLTLTTADTAGPRSLERSLAGEVVRYASLKKKGGVPSAYDGFLVGVAIQASNAASIVSKHWT